jgi:hypothetical protein
MFLTVLTSNETFPVPLSTTLVQFRFVLVSPVTSLVRGDRTGVTGVT